MYYSTTMKLLVLFSTLLAISMASNVFRTNYFNSLQENKSKLRIIDGKNATRNQFPYMASLQGFWIDGYAHFCGGSIISENWILTACHCIFGESPVNLRVVAGVLLLSEAYSNQDVGQQIRNMSKIIQHPLFPGPQVTSPYDIALILLDHPLQFTISVQPIPIPTAGLVSRGFGYVSGWGITVWEGPGSDPLLWTYLPIIPELECKEILYAMTGRNDFDENFNLCSGHNVALEQPCVGDSGSPYAIDGKIIGIVSWSVDKCGVRKQPSIYAKVSSFIDWITSNTNGEVRPQLI